ncbi:MAG: class I SAM-dependent methyltransferase [Deltaproteobacteria bacterium]|nr:class I SAM-dependent methyltransferase [Deltaproteobacteria bacterium]
MTSAPRTEPFVIHHVRYDDWFERHRAAYLSELLAVRALLPWEGQGLEIGVGTGRFAGPLGVKFGIDPAGEMLGYARARGVSVAGAVAEGLPFLDAVFHYALVVTTICFVDDARAMLREIARVLRPGGKVVIGLIDRESPLGQDYVTHQAENVFYREATFYSAAEVEALLKETGFSHLVWVQTLSMPLSQIHEIEPTSAGTDRGAFLVVRAQAPSKIGVRREECC